MEPTLAELVYESVNEEYGWGRYGEFRVLIRKSDGYINATKLCKDGGKRFSDWSALKGSVSLMEEFHRHTKILVCPVDSLTTGPNELRGTYAHPDLIPHIASWISNEFAFKVSRIVNDYIVREHKREIARQKLALGEKQDKIDELLAKMDQQTEMLKNLEITNRQQSEELKNSGEMLKDLTITNYHQSAVLEQNQYMLGVMDENVIETLATLHHVSDNSVPADRIPDRKSEQLVIVYTGSDDNGGNYAAIRAQKSYVQTKVNTLKRGNPEVRVVSQMPNRPNSRELWLAVQAILINEPGIVISGTKFSMPVGMETWLIEQLNACNDEKFDELTGARGGIVDRTKAALKSVRDLMSMKMDELKNICRENGMKGWSKLNKVALANFIADGSQ